jgi:hypothetical protein
MRFGELLQQDDLVPLLSRSVETLGTIPKPPSVQYLVDAPEE